MDAVERMRRLNDLAKELKNRGFAESSSDAMAQAQQIYGEDELTHNVQHGLIQHTEHEKFSRGGTEMVEGNDDKKLAKLSENVNVLTDKMNEIIKAINDLDARLAEVHKKTDRLAVEASRPAPKIERQAEKPVEKSTENPTEAHTGTATDAEHAKKDEYALNQRTGNFAPQDVAIDKMFYFGKK